jgi:YVTN family beta-propeller protein
MRRSFAAITALACLVAPASVLAENAYITNLTSANVSVIDTATNTVIATIPVIFGPNGVAVTPDGSKVYVANSGSNNVFVIDTATNAVLAVVSVGIQPVAFGAFIRQPAAVAAAGPPFAGTPREPDCHGKSVSALAKQFGGLPAAATARGFSSVPALQDAINVFCRGGAAAAG